VGHLDGAVERWELCAFNNLCRDQYRRLGIEWAYADTPLMTRASLDALANEARASGVDPGLVAVTGAARVEPAVDGEERTP
jgi:pyruvate formate lyase activating enzyme